jgi:hypothetical protein
MSPLRRGRLLKQPGGSHGVRLVTHGFRFETSCRSPGVSAKAAYRHRRICDTPLHSTGAARHGRPAPLRSETSVTNADSSTGGSSSSTRRTHPSASDDREPTLCCAKDGPPARGPRHVRARIFDLTDPTELQARHAEWCVMTHPTEWTERPRGWIKIWCDYNSPVAFGSVCFAGDRAGVVSARVGPGRSYL